MNQKETENKLKKVIIVLAILLILCLAALVGTLIYNRLAESSVATVTVPDNYITSDGGSAGSSGEAGGSEDTASDDSDNTANAESHTSAGTSAVKQAEKTANSVTVSKSQNKDKRNHSTTAAAPASSSGAGQMAGNGSRQAVSLKLYNRKPQENAAFHVDNMFPGDSVTQYFRVQVSYQNPITVRYHADVREGDEKLAEVLNVRVRLLSGDEELYDGPIGDMPQSLDYRLSGSSKTTDELYYEITAYLDTSVGNDYQNLGLTADFRWWVEEAGNLTKPPKTGDSFNLVLWAAVVIISGSICVLLIINRRRRRDVYHE